MATTFPGAALVTGAAGGKPPIYSDIIVLTDAGIGAATAIAFAKAGCTRIAITDIQPAALDKTRDDILSTSKNKDINVLAIPGDITSEPFIETLISSAFNEFGRLDYVVNCAGVLQNDFARSTDVSTQQFDFINGVNYRGTWLVSRAALRRMLTQTPLKEEGDGGESWRPRQRGSIVNVASQLGVVSRAGAGEISIYSRISMDYG
jgi:NAD(P)-dependent dehydrogenase (short-subunit alcohol dehydrogenase family)